MAKKRVARSGGTHGSCRSSDDLLDVVVVILEGGYTSTAVAPIEIFHAAGVVWNWLHGEAVKPRFQSADRFYRWPQREISLRLGTHS